MLAGLRFDYLQQIRHDYTAANINLDRSDRAWSLRVGLMYEPLDWLTIYGSTCAWTRTRLYGGDRAEMDAVCGLRVSGRNGWRFGAGGWGGALGFVEYTGTHAAA